MFNNENMSGCGFSDEIVSYIYNELPISDRRTFESHLMQCTPCTDEFAAISEARFSVFEWHKNEFVALETPRIVIPYEQPANRRVQETTGFFVDFGQLVGGWRLAFAAVVLAIVGIGFLTFNYYKQKEHTVATNEPSAEPVAYDFDNSANVAVNRSNELTVGPEIVPPKAPVEKSFASHPAAVQIVRSITRPRARPRSQNSADVATQTVINRQNKAPELSNFDDSDDKSLRLADLFDTEVGAKR